MDLADLTHINVMRAKRWHPGFPDDDAWTIADWSNAMCGEAGEAANVVKKLRRIDAGHHGALDPERNVLVEKLAEELADVLLYLNLVAAKEGIDLEEAVIRKFNAVSVREGWPDLVIQADPLTDIKDVISAIEKAHFAQLGGDAIVYPNAVEQIIVKPDQVPDTQPWGPVNIVLDPNAPRDAIVFIDPATIKPCRAKHPSLNRSCSLLAGHVGHHSIKLPDEDAAVIWP